MKKTLILTALGATIMSPAIAAVQKCVSLQATENYTSLFGSAVEVKCADWGAIGSTSKITVEGVGVCSNNAGTSSTRDNLSFDTSSTTNNKYCWCKMISPAISKWVYSGGNKTSEATCLRDCAANCAAAMQYSNYRGYFFSNLTD